MSPNHTPKLPLNEHISIVTGCSSGLGKALTSSIHAAGHRIVATARNADSLSYLPDGPNILKLSLDVTSREAITQSLSAAVDKFGRIDVVINNAGYALIGDTEAIPESDARLQMETLFWGPVFLTQEAVGIMRDRNPRGHGGTIVQISSIGGMLTFPGSAFYHASKHALNGFTDSFAKEMNPDWNIKFLVVAPGGIRTNFDSSMQLAARHPAYDTPEGSLNQLVAYIGNKEFRKSWSDPELCARVLFEVVVGQKERSPPRRLLMGEGAIELLVGRDFQ
ncbi:NAD(P)-binding protein [Aspergillus steynii IBT 23096]|uniref:NAD(P)-binding protein n=1 Tax=Aspergillus steynii IBT 23096 TaxID=1392250 RepID=A0A2I2G534_9EURO|nr:NAD(P)-binding protein [Aspergillus steynii IBT 23096]PLB47992.1 NAD(P)-binding protein [Aspergillus steynii IBT 23096]